MDKDWLKEYNEFAWEYTSEQMDAVMDFIEEKFGNGEGLVAHEITSKYVHTDVVITENDDYQHFVTCGMGAREMPNCKVFIDKALSRIELAIVASKERALTDHEKLILANELCRISKYPFRTGNFLGPGHTMDVGSDFAKAFGYEYFLFHLPYEELTLEDVGDITFLPLIPIYEEEREWMVNNNSFEWLQAFCESDSWNIEVDKKREVFIPNE